MQYLESNQILSEKITNQILFLLKEMKRLKFTRLDARLKHIIVTKQGELKVVDLVNHLKKRYDRPEFLMTGLEKLGFIILVFGASKKYRQTIISRMEGFPYNQVRETNNLNRFCKVNEKFITKESHRYL